MQKAGVVVLILLMGLPILLSAQDNSDPSIETDWDDYKYDLYAAGDQTFIINLGVVFPVIFLNQGNRIAHQISPPVGGSGSLIYNYYLTSRFFIGGEVSGMFLPTLGGNTVFLIPAGIRVGTQFLRGRFEFPISFTLGASWHKYLNFGHFGVFGKVGASAYYRVSNSWAYGLSANWFMIPQFTGNRSQNVIGNVVTFSLSARYHF